MILEKGILDMESGYSEQQNRGCVNLTGHTDRMREKQKNIPMRQVNV